jgi:hypothetical protein
MHCPVIHARGIGEGALVTFGDQVHASSEVGRKRPPQGRGVYAGRGGKQIANCASVPSCLFVVMLFEA